MNQTVQAVVDQAICRAITEQQQTARRWQPFQAGEVVPVTVVENGETEAVDGVVEQRHLDAVAAFVKGYPFGLHAEVEFRIPPAEVA